MAACKWRKIKVAILPKQQRTHGAVLRALNVAAPLFVLNMMTVGDATALYSWWDMGVLHNVTTSTT